MKRKSFCIFIILMLVLMLPGVASAKGNGNGYANGNHYGCTMDARVGGGAKKLEIKVRPGKNGQKQANKKLQKLVDKANKQIEKLVRRAQRTPQDDVQELLAAVDEIVASVFRAAEATGAELACDYTEYYIDGQYVLIDPIRIVRL